MQHEAFANTEDFGGPDIVAGPGRTCRPGQDAPYQNYELAKAYDEMFTPEGACRPPYAALDSRISTLPLEELNRRQQAVEQSFLHQGITFTVYSDNQRHRADHSHRSSAAHRHGARNGTASNAA